MLDAEADKLVGAERYARDENRKGYRVGHYNRSLSTTAGDVNLRMSKLKGIAFETTIIERYKRCETSVEEALIEMYLDGRNNVYFYFQKEFAQLIICYPMFAVSIDDL